MGELPVLKAPDECLKEPWKRVPGYIRLTFSSSLVLGLVLVLLYPLFLRYFLASTTGEVCVYEGLYVNEPQMAEILTMPVYPRAGSIRVIDGFVAVRLN